MKAVDWVINVVLALAAAVTALLILVFFITGHLGFLLIAVVLLLAIAALWYVRKHREVYDLAAPGTSKYGVVSPHLSAGSMLTFLILFLVLSRLDVDEMFTDVFGQHGKMIYLGLLLGIVCIPFLFRRK
jgi:hypothetical protein